MADEPPQDPELVSAARAQDRERVRAARRRHGTIEMVLGIAVAIAGIVLGSLSHWQLELLGVLIVGGLVIVGIAFALTGAVHRMQGDTREHTADAAVVLGTHRGRVLRGWIEIVVGLIGVVGGIAYLFASRHTLGRHVVKYAVTFGPYIVGYVAFVVGILRLMNARTGLVKPHEGEGKRNDISVGVGFRTFVAWRYLMARHHKVSRVVLAMFFVALFVLVTSLLLWSTIVQRANPLGLEPDTINAIARGVLIAMIASGALIYFAVLIGLLRFVFSFFTTVPVVGVWIGVAALICVLSVMSGFENDLRQKILGSNAHIQITADSGEIENWRELMDRIGKVPGVLASTPYATSEVVIAANNNGMNVIIKGIDPASVGQVTKLVSSIRDNPAEAMKRLEPLIHDKRDLTVPQPAATPGDSDVVDPAPDDMPASGDPIDYSAPETPSAADDTPSVPAPPPPPTTPVTHPSAGSGSAAVGSGSGSAAVGSAGSAGSAGSGSTDGSDDFDEMPIEAVDVSLDSPAANNRTQSLPGILVGQELVKQTHLYVGQEVRVVSPLSDPANPDATGTPIPFNRDYRVAGVFFTGMYEYDLKYVYVTLDSLQDFLDRGESIDGIEVRIGSPDDTDEYVQRLQKVLDDAYGKLKYRVQDWKELNRSLFSALKLEKIAMFLVLGIVILVASFSIVGNLIMVVVEKAREIALIKTLGASDQTVMTVFAIQGLLIGLIGTGLGVGTGLFACLLGQHYGIPLNPDVYYIDKMPVNIETSSVVITAAAGILISMLATFYPAVVAARVRPAAGMRH